MSDSSVILENVKEYYGKRLKSSKDLKTNACKITSKKSNEIILAEQNIPEEVKSKYYGCGLISPDNLLDCRIIDLGCGTGYDCFILSQLVGQNGEITGIDMTEESLEIAKKCSEEFQNNCQNTSVSFGALKFQFGYLENLPTDSDFFDIAVSNCVLNLCYDKRLVLKECLRVLKNGGELYFSDVYSDKPVPEKAQEDKVLWGDCISGALPWTELHNLANELGFATPRLIRCQPIEIYDPAILELLGGPIQFTSATYRLFKLINTDQHASVYIVKYIGENKLEFDHATEFQKEGIYQVDQELYSILTQSRYSKYFELLDVSDVVDQSSLQIMKKMEPVDPFKVQPSKGQSCCSKKKCC